MISNVVLVSDIWKRMYIWIDTYMCTTELLCCAPETNTTLLSAFSHSMILYWFLIEFVVQFVVQTIAIAN